MNNLGSTRIHNATKASFNDIGLLVLEKDVFRLLPYMGMVANAATLFM